MWLNRHHTCGDIIDLDHLTGHWRPVDDNEKPAGARVLADLPVYGSYEIEDEKRYCKYWTDDNTFVFRTPENHVFEICRKTSDGRIIESQPGLHAEIEDTKYSDGRLRQGFSDFRLFDKDDKVLYELSYNSAFYLRLYGSDFTAASMVEDLSDWDFFVALKGAIEVFAERAASGRGAMTYNAGGSAQIGAARVASGDVFSPEQAKSARRLVFGPQPMTFGARPCSRKARLFQVTTIVQCCGCGVGTNRFGRCASPCLSIKTNGTA